MTVYAAGGVPANAEHVKHADRASRGVRAAFWTAIAVEAVWLLALAWMAAR